MEKKSPESGTKNTAVLTVCLTIIAVFSAGCEKEANGKALPADAQNPAAIAADEPAPLGTEDQKTLLKIARNAVETYVATGQTPKVANPSPALQNHLGSFVTLKENGDLRGCIGRFEPDVPLHEVVTQMAIAAATEDTRFAPVRKEEFPLIRYEISVLSPLKKVPNADGIIAGTHGVQVRKGFRGGVFLPQVATEHHLDKEAFLSLLCTEKAGLPPNCWKDPGTDLYVFTAQVFSEEELEGNQTVNGE